MEVRPCGSSFLSRIGLAALAVVVSAAGAQAQTAPAAAPAAAGSFMNVQILKDMSPVQLHDTMVYFEASVGGNCLSCHVRGADGELAFEKDDNDHKVTARKMIQMVRAINTEHFKGEARVTCATCHQARREPSPIPPLSLPLTPDQLASMPQPRPPAAPGAAPAGAPPAGGQAAPGGRGEGPRPGAGPGGGRGPQRPVETVDQVIDRYIEALGGREALQKLTTRIRRGSVTNRANQTVPVTIEDTAAGQYRATTEGTPAAMTRAWDGKAAWGQGGNRIRDFEGVEAANVALGADLALALAIKDTYTAMAVRAYARIAGHDVIVMQGRRGGMAETLMFDRATGLLARRQVHLKTPMGELPVQIDYNDYRRVGGVQAAFDVRVADWESVSLMTFTDISFNQPIDAARFSRPSPRPGL